MSDDNKPTLEALATGLHFVERGRQLAAVLLASKTFENASDLECFIAGCEDAMSKMNAEYERLNGPYLISKEQ